MHRWEDLYEHLPQRSSLHWEESSGVTLTVYTIYLFEWMPRLQLFSGPERCSIHSRAATIRGWLSSAKNMVSQVDEAFHVNSIVHGLHVYNRAWTLFWGVILSATVAAAIPNPSHHIFALAAVVAVPLTIK